MKIELYLREIGQEYPDVQEGEQLFNVWQAKEVPPWQEAGPPWTDKWQPPEPPEPPWKYQSSSLDKSKTASTTKMQRLVLREEKFGGLIYDPFTTAVFKADKEAMDAIKYLQREYQINDLHNAIGIPKGSIKKLVFLFKKFDLWQN